MNEKKIDEWLLNNWFKASIIILLSITIFLLGKYFVFTPEAAYNAKKQECLLLMTKFEYLLGENKTKEELKDATTNLPHALGYDLKEKDLYECFAFLESESIDYPLRHKNLNF